ncbi:MULTISPECIES: hypothetical protein [unclassified Serratia (in: enterobacteria)]|uniref:hypothetical protein n=1 Tax=unclassified Serratia (in: enterobacteria) TaxID=2647522 RepID=UPI00046ACD25|nr:MULTISPECIES: hypothetical protein [unclassified Serratia (in: enterobacteria)]
MTEKVKVSISANQHIHLDKTVEMDKADFEKYQRICAEGIDLDSLIGEITCKYGLGVQDCCYENDPEDITFELVPQTK